MHEFNAVKLKKLLAATCSKKETAKPKKRCIHLWYLSRRSKSKVEQPSNNQRSMDWFKGKSTGNHRFSHEDHGAFRLKFSLKPIQQPERIAAHVPNSVPGLLCRSTVRFTSQFWAGGITLEHLRMSQDDSGRWANHQEQICYSHWIGLRENLQETHGFLPSNIGLSCKFSHHPILWYK